MHVLYNPGASTNMPSRKKKWIISSYSLLLQGRKHFLKGPQRQRARAHGSENKGLNEITIIKTQASCDPKTHASGIDSTP